MFFFFIIQFVILKCYANKKDMNTPFMCIYCIQCHVIDTERMHIYPLYGDTGAHNLIKSPSRHTSFAFMTLKLNKHAMCPKPDFIKVLMCPPTSSFTKQAEIVALLLSQFQCAQH